MSPSKTLTLLVIAASLAASHAQDGGAAGTTTDADTDAASFDVGPGGSAIDSGQHWQREIHLGSLYSDDFSDWTPALHFDFGYRNSKAEDWPERVMALNFTAKGAVAADRELNREPLRASLGFYRMLMPEFGEEIQGWNDPLVVGEKPHSNPWMLEYGLAAGYETDQLFDHRSGTASAYASFFAPLSNAKLRGLMPSLTAALDGVFPDENATADAMGIDRDEHLRLRLAADWVLRMSVYTEAPVISKLVVHTVAEYSKEFHPDRSWEKEGLDESLGAYVEVSYRLRTGFEDATTTSHGTPITLFVRSTFGRIAPQPEEDTSVHAGVRFTF